MDSCEPDPPVLMSSPNKTSISRTIPLCARRNGNYADGSLSNTPTIADTIGLRREAQRSVDGSVDTSPLGLGTRAISVDHFATVPRLTTTIKKTMTVRALFDYDPSVDTGLPSRGLSFHHGDILYVVNANDREWWQARKLTLIHNPSSVDAVNSSVISRTPLGIIPSSERIERRHRIKSKRVNFFTKVTVIGSNAPLPSSLTPLHPHSIANSVNHPSGRPPHPFVSRALNSEEPSDLPSASPLNGNHPGTTPPEDKYSSLEQDSNSASLCDSEKKSRSNSLTLSLFKRFSGRVRRKENISSLGGSFHANPVESGFEGDVTAIRSYELVIPLTINLNRPLLVFGPLKERVIDALLQDPKFTSCVPHTTRPPQAGEIDGVDYHFVGSKAEMEDQIRSDRFIQVGQFQDHYYATSVDAVRQVLQSGRVCVLSVNLTAIKRLELEGLYPISILLKPLSVLHLRAIQRRLTEDQAKRSIDLALRLEADNWRLFSTIVVFDTIESAVSSIRRFVQLHNGPVIWVSSHCPLPRFNRGPPVPVGSQSSTLPRAPLPIPQSTKH